VLALLHFAPALTDELRTFFCEVATRPPQAGPLGGTAAGGPHDGGKGDNSMVVGHTSSHPRLHGGGQPTLVSRGYGKPRPWHAAGLLTSLHRAPYYNY